VPKASSGSEATKTPSADTSPPATPSTAPNTNPARRPTRAIHIDAGNIIAAVPTNIVAMGKVAHRGALATCAPARPPIVMTRTETVWNSAWATARIRTWRRMDASCIVSAGSMERVGRSI
jgi:hypothetical protein